MNIVKFTLLILAIYLASLGIALIVKHETKIFPFLHVFILSLIIFSALFIIFIVFLAIFYAIKKKPEIEYGNYSIDRIKGKEE
ncbi:hypothetical protein B6U81_05855 [Thermoplasmatales archaeon ex4484_30]|nr:MAG: hypothetical protein FE041_05620 [Thermoplasmata archaeon]OYT59577.1 MAG: hypothetical protein B6U81_05855 [Thermoplasmatales archaeon ex4484_30]